MNIIKILFLILLFGCATYSKIVLPDGTKGYSVNCDGSAVSENVCYEKAGELCPNGYDILVKNKDKTAFVQGNGLNYSSGSFNTKGFLIRCK
jgi:hypothetical protein